MALKTKIMHVHYTCASTCSMNDAGIRQKVPIVEELTGISRSPFSKKGEI